MLVEDVLMCESLRKIVNGFTGDLAMQQDMLQECLVCLWKIESEKPGRTKSWYLQNCRFHVQHWLASGRSLDSHKRAIGGNRVSLCGTDEESALEGYHTNGELFEAVSLRDLVSTLTPLLKPAERTVLRGLAEGLILREIASRSRISYPTALKYRRRIATLTTRLGALFPASSRQQNGNAKSPRHEDVPTGRMGEKNVVSDQGGNSRFCAAPKKNSVHVPPKAPKNSVSQPKRARERRLSKDYAGTKRKSRPRNQPEELAGSGRSKARRLAA
jgi:DNA-binding CsgD family transcriptional regulator